MKKIFQVSTPHPRRSPPQKLPMCQATVVGRGRRVLHSTFKPWRPHFKAKSSFPPRSYLNKWVCAWGILRGAFCVTGSAVPSMKWSLTLAGGLPLHGSSCSSYSPAVQLPATNWGQPPAASSHSVWPTVAASSVPVIPTYVKSLCMGIHIHATSQSLLIQLAIQLPIFQHAHPGYQQSLPLQRT